MISVSCFEVGFCESDVCFRGVVVVPCIYIYIYISVYIYIYIYIYSPVIYACTGVNSRLIN